MLDPQRIFWFIEFIFDLRTNLKSDEPISFGDVLRSSIPPIVGVVVALITLNFLNAPFLIALISYVIGTALTYPKINSWFIVRDFCAGIFILSLVWGIVGFK